MRKICFRMTVLIWQSCFTFISFSQCLCFCKEHTPSTCLFRNIPVRTYNLCSFRCPCVLSIADVSLYWYHHLNPCSTLIFSFPKTLLHDHLLVSTRVRATSPTLMCDAQVQHQRHRTRRVREVTSQLNVPTSLTPDPSHLLRFRFVCCAKEVIDFINHPVVSLLGTRVGGTSAEVVPRGSIWNVLQPQVKSGISARSGIWGSNRHSKEGRD